jgi:KEOPS complex subunit Pcc1
VPRAIIELPKNEEIYTAIKVEAGREIPRTKVDITLDGTLKIVIDAKDTHALRAALNSYLRWIDLAYNVMEVIENGRT